MRLSLPGSGDGMGEEPVMNGQECRRNRKRVNVAGMKRDEGQERDRLRGDSESGAEAPCYSFVQSFVLEAMGSPCSTPRREGKSG